MNADLIIGYQGQDGRYLTDLLTNTGREVVGLGRSGAVNLSTGKEYRASLADQAAMKSLLAAVSPRNIYYLAAFHHSSEDARPETASLWRQSFETNTDGLVNTLEAVLRASPDSRLFYASSSHIFGATGVTPQNELTPRLPQNIYGIAKSAGMSICNYYRQAHNIYAACGILYNHESPLREPKYITRKISSTAVEISAGRREQLELFDLSAKVDWGFAGDYVQAMSNILDLDAPDDFIIATGKLHSVQEFVERCFSKLGLDWQDHVTETARTGTVPAAAGILCGDNTKLRTAVGWEPTTSFAQLVDIMIEGEYQQR